MMLTLADVQHELASLVFWPNFRFSATHHPFRGIIIHITFTVDNTNDLGKTVVEKVEIGNHHNVPHIALRSRRSFHDWLLEELCQKAIHETVEAYKPDGERWHDPHDGVYPWLV